MRPHALQPGAIQGKEGIKFCHLATSLRCRPEGAPQPKFVWRKNANRIASGGKYTVYDNGNLLINRLDRADSGTYTCEAQNEYGKAESSGDLFVKQGPTFQPPGEKPNPRLSVIKGDDVELRCRAEADQLLDMAYKWRLNGLTIRYSDKTLNW